MKKIYLLLIAVFILIIFAGCTVNENTGLILVNNMSDIIITNVKVGDTILAGYLTQGSGTSYWYSSSINGKISADGVEDFRTPNPPDETDPNLTFQKGYKYDITIYKIGSDYHFKIDTTKSGHDHSDSYDEPWD